MHYTISLRPRAVSFPTEDLLVGNIEKRTENAAKNGWKPKEA